MPCVMGMVVVVLTVVAVIIFSLYITFVSKWIKKNKKKLTWLETRCVLSPSLSCPFSILCHLIPLPLPRSLHVLNVIDGGWPEARDALCFGLPISSHWLFCSLLPINILEYSLESNNTKRKKEKTHLWLKQCEALFGPILVIPVVPALFLSCIL